jgi:hypothetical protein
MPPEAAVCGMSRDIRGIAGRLTGRPAGLTRHEEPPRSACLRRPRRRRGTWRKHGAGLPRHAPRPLGNILGRHPRIQPERYGGMPQVVGTARQGRHNLFGCRGNGPGLSPHVTDRRRRDHVAPVAAELLLVRSCLPMVGANGGGDITREGGSRFAAGGGHHGVSIGSGQRPAGLTETQVCGGRARSWPSASVRSM